MKRKSQITTRPLLRLDLGSGKRPAEGFQGVDIANLEGIIQQDLTQYPWPWDDGSVEAVHSSHFLEHLTGSQRIDFMNELYRVMIVGGTASFITPYWSSMRAIQDPTHQWPPIAESSYLYWNRKWREDNGLDHYPITCDFDFTYGYDLAPSLTIRSDEYRMFAVEHYLNSVTDLHVVLTKRPAV